MGDDMDKASDLAKIIEEMGVIKVAEELERRMGGGLEGKKEKEIFSLLRML